MLGELRDQSARESSAGVGCGGNATHGELHLSTCVCMVVLDDIGLPPGLTLGVTGRLVALTVMPEGRTGMDEADERLVASPLGDCSPMAGADEVPLMKEPIQLMVKLPLLKTSS